LDSSHGSILEQGRVFSKDNSGAAWSKHGVDATTNLSPANWIPILTNQSPFTLKDTSTQSQRFYRARFMQ
jgi:hypothetical protein